MVVAGEFGIFQNPSRRWSFRAESSNPAVQPTGNLHGVSDFARRPNILWPQSPEPPLIVFFACNS